MPQSNAAIQLRDVEEADLPFLFEFHTDPIANQMAAFTPENASDREAFYTRWGNILDNDSRLKQVILLDEVIVGFIASFDFAGNRAVGYWIGRDYWGKGIATQALTAFLNIETTRPLFAHVAFDNAGSRRVLEKCGFKLHGKDTGYANARQAEIEEFIFRLE